MMTTVLQDGRREGARRFFVAGDLIVELRQRCTDDDGEMREFSGRSAGTGLTLTWEGSRRRCGWNL